MTTRFSKRFLAAQSIALMLTLLTAGNALAHNWQPVGYNGGNFTLQMPGTPERSTTSTRIGEHDTPMYNLRYATGSEVFFVTFSDFPVPRPNTKLIDEVRDGQVGKDHLVSEKPIWVDGRYGKEIVIQMQNGILASRIVVDGLRVYQVIYSTNSNQVSPAGAAFLSSFRITR
jgi:hypothetical protein